MAKRFEITDDDLTQLALEGAFCWEAEDLIPSRPAMTAFRRRIRLLQARWREDHGHPIGTQPIAPRPGDPDGRPLGNRLPLDYGRQTGATFVTPAALAAARERTSFVEREQSFDHQRFWADLLWSPALAFNLFGDLAADARAADRAAHVWWPDMPGVVREIRFAHSPGRLDRAYLNSLRAFDAAFVLDLDDGSHGIVAIDVNYHERAKAETPKPENLTRYVQVADRSRAFAPGAIDVLKGRSELAVMWLEHLLLFSMLQHPTDGWSWGRYVVVYPEGNLDLATMVERYRSSLVEPSSYRPMTLEVLLDAGVLPADVTAAVLERYLPA